jgi:hypothetical protein
MKNKETKKTCSNCYWNDGFDCRNTQTFYGDKETWDGVCRGWKSRGKK